MLLAALPLLVIVIGAYNVVALLGAGTAWTLLDLALPSGTILPLTFGDLLVTGGIVLLFLEIWKSTRTGTSSVIDHLLSMLLFVVALIEFLLLPAFGTATFAILMVLSFVDVIAGFAVSISSARRDIDVTRM